MGGIWNTPTAIGAERLARMHRTLATIPMVVIALAAAVDVLATSPGQASAASPPGSVGKALGGSASLSSSDWAGASFCSSEHNSPYMGVTFDGVAVCGTTSNASGTSNEQGDISYSGVTLDTVGFQCVELAARYLYYTTGDIPPQVNGDEFAAAVHSAYKSIPVFRNGTVGQLYAPGDIVSFTGNAGTPVAGIGHVAVVTASTENASGNGTVKIMEENAAKSPQETLDVRDWSLQQGAGEWVTPYDFDRLNLANSVTEYSSAQGKYGWYYGYYASPPSPKFTKMTIYDPQPPFAGATTDTWWENPSDYWTLITRTYQHPESATTSGGRVSTNQWSVRRWVSDYAGHIVITGHIAKQNVNTFGDGVTARILVDGAQIAQSHLAADNGTGFDYRVSASVKVGSTIDFALDPDSNDWGDGTYFTATISS